MNDWDKAVIAFHSKKELPACPMCRQGKLSARLYEHEGRASLTLQCEKCGAFEHYDGIKAE